MMKIYEEDYKLVQKMRKKQRKRHPNWEKSKKLRFILWGCSITITILMILYSFFVFEGIFDRLLGSFFCGAGAFIIASIPAAIYTIAVAEECEDFIGRDKNEFIVIEDKIIKYGYQSNKDRGNQYTVDELQYTKIQRIVYNKYHERIDIYGNRTKVCYENYQTGEVGGSRGVKGKKSKMRIYLYFKDCDDMLENILKHTNVKPEIIDYPEE